MPWWRKRDDLTYHVSGKAPRHFVVRAEGSGFRHDEHGRVGFVASRAVTAPHEDNALAQTRALVPVQLMPWGVPDDDFELRLTVVRESKPKGLRRIPRNGFVFYESET